jgi:hypothetical protein
MLHTCFGDFESVIRKVFDVLTPGGYFELQDSLPITCADGSWNGTDIQRWAGRVLEGAEKLGKDWAKVGNYRKWMDAAGFVGIKEVKRYWPTNPWPKGEYHKHLGRLTNDVLRNGVHAISIEVLTEGLGMSSTDVEELLEAVRENLNDRSIHCYIPMYVHGLFTGIRCLLTMNRRVIYGQKPE